jgi:iron complex transport system permease protein
MLILSFLILAAFLTSMNLGLIRLSPTEIFWTLAGKGTTEQETVLLFFRLPRIVIAVLVGAGLAISGTILQGIVRNGLADPGLVGINAGAGLAVASYIVISSSHEGSIRLTGGYLQIFALPFIALLGAGLAAVLIYLLAWKRGVSAVRLILAGVALTFAMNAAMLVVLTRMTRGQTNYTRIWITGSIWGTSWEFVLVLLPWILILIPFAIYKARVLNVLNLGDSVSHGLGMSVEFERRTFLVIAVALAAASVAIAGGISFLGLIGPHIAKRLVGVNHKALLPVAALVGGLLLIVADTIGHNLFAPIEIPVGVVVAAIGAPYFLYLLARSRV